MYYTTANTAIVFTALVVVSAVHAHLHVILPLLAAAAVHACCTYISTCTTTTHQPHVLQCAKCSGTAYSTSLSTLHISVQHFSSARFFPKQFSSCLTLLVASSVSALCTRDQMCVRTGCSAMQLYISIAY
jgi:hypothetical protein